MGAHRTALTLFQALLAPNNARSQRDVVLAYARTADILFKLGNHKEALEIELKGLDIDEGALKTDPSNANAQRDVHVDYFKLARVQAALGVINAAFNSERKSIEMIEAEIAANSASSSTNRSRGGMRRPWRHAGEEWQSASGP